MSIKKTSVLNCSVALAMLAISSTTWATNGYFQHGYGVKSQGMAGVGIALPQDGLAAATNPAGQAFVGDRADLGLTWFVPKRGAEVVGNPMISGSYDGNETRNFFIPEFGYVKQVTPALAAGVAVYGNGGMNTDYSRNPFAGFGSTGTAYMNMEQLFIAPALAWKVTPQQSLGVALNLAYQRFSIKGLGAFANPMFSSDTAHVTDRGTDTSTGAGVRLGWTGQVLPSLTLGATWASKTRMGKLDKYRGLFAEQGSFDVPANYGVGVAWKPLGAQDALTLALDVQRIEYSGVKSVGNSLANLFAGNPLGSNNGGGFGWRDVTATKLGVSYEASRDLTLRAGYSHNTQPIPADQTMFNIIAPGVIKEHLSLGGSWKIGTGELSAAYTHAFKNTVNGSGSIPAMMGGGEANLHLKEDIFGVAWGWKL
ncbi:MAG: outer membrane protein transport protein [Sterolibacterium sp.]|jgi:long-chain fatty acid transport protein|nr:outer membrane protein transport protein [Sterolibacterium sp.]